MKSFEEKLKIEKKRIASQKTLQWMRDNPERDKQNKQRSAQKTRRLRQEAKDAFEKTPHKTMHKAIKAFCNQCPNGTSRKGFNYAPVECSQTDCPLFCFRNFNASVLDKSDEHAKHMRKVRDLKKAKT